MLKLLQAVENITGSFTMITKHRKKSKFEKLYEDHNKKKSSCFPFK